MVLGSKAISQENFILSDTILPSTRGFEKNPLQLANSLTDGKKTDKEKFDAIFTWVTKNIRYNYYAYMAPTGSPKPRIDRILKYKSGICMDYAFLMDTLCALAGIKNVSVYGYVKDALFDVADSIYMDNHAWNAVKLNNYWYVYDVTWSSGEYKWEYKRFSKRILNRPNKILAKKREITKIYKSFRITECEITESAFKRKYFQFSLKHRIMLRFLLKFKLKKCRVFVKPKRPDYYLTNPEVFAITHFPDNPYWSLIATQESIRSFETDSSYYNLNDSVYIKQKREGRFCSDCDNYFSLDEMNKQKEMKKIVFSLIKEIDL